MGRQFYLYLYQHKYNQRPEKNTNIMSFHIKLDQGAEQHRSWNTTGPQAQG